MIRKREAAIAASLVLAIVASVGFMAAYALHAGTQFEGLGLAAAAVGFVLAALGFARSIVGEEQVVDPRDSYPSDRRDRAGAVEAAETSEAEVTRSSLLVKLWWGALGALGVAVLFPLRSFGPVPGNALFKTKWKAGARAVREDGSHVRRDDLKTDSVVTVFPEGASGDPASQAVLIRLPDGLGRSVDGYVAYSKVCTHAGCPVALYRAAEHQLMCPCHQSVFDAVDGGKVLFGPADHALPQLPIEIDAQGYVRATGDFPVPIGPGFWERG